MFITTFPNKQFLYTYFSDGGNLIQYYHRHESERVFPILRGLEMNRHLYGDAPHRSGRSGGGS